jgi:transposase
MKGRKSLYDKEFRLNTLKLLESGEKSILSISRDLGLSPNTIGNWKKAYREGKLDGTTPAIKLKPEEIELRLLKKELATVKMERDILKKAVAYFAKEE